MVRSVDPRRTGLGCCSDMAMVLPLTYAALMNQSICGWVNEKVPGAALVVLTDAGLIYDIPAGRQVLVTQYCYAVETTSDDCQFEFGYVDAGGTFRGLGPHKHVYTGAANQGRTAYDQDIDPPMIIRYSQGARRITFRVDANDAACEITVGWHGVWLNE